MNGIATFGDKKSAVAPLFASHKAVGLRARKETMISGIAAFGMAVGGTSLVCYLLMNRVQNRRARRGSSGGSGLDGGGSVDDSLFGWSGGGHASLDSSGNPSGGGSDGAGGGDGGGGGDSGGGD
jgi:hypothetical protein